MEVLGMLAQTLPGFMSRDCIKQLLSELKGQRPNRNNLNLRTGADWTARITEWRLGLFTPDQVRIVFIF